LEPQLNFGKEGTKQASGQIVLGYVALFKCHAKFCRFGECVESWVVTPAYFRNQ